MKNKATENPEKKKFEIRSTIRQNDGGQESETNSKCECSNDQKEEESRIAQIQRILATKTRRHEENHRFVQIHHEFTRIDTKGTADPFDKLSANRTGKLRTSFTD